MSAYQIPAWADVNAKVRDHGAASLTALELFVWHNEPSTMDRRWRREFATAVAELVGSQEAPLTVEYHDGSVMVVLGGQRRVAANSEEASRIVSAYHAAQP